MSTQGKIKTLFSDKEKTEALFPRTKINAVSDENGKGLNAILDDMAYVGDITEDVASTPVNADLLGGRPAGEYATQNYVAAEIAKAQLEGDDVDLSGFATKDDVGAAINSIDHPVDSVNGKTGIVILSASDVGAAPASHAEDKNNPHGVDRLPSIDKGTSAEKYIQLCVADMTSTWSRAHATLILTSSYTGTKYTAIISARTVRGSGDITVEFDQLTGKDITSRLFYYVDGNKAYFYYFKPINEEVYFTCLNADGSMTVEILNVGATLAAYTGTAKYELGAAAPAGYGLGGRVQTAQDNNPDNIAATGFYRCELSSVFGDTAWCEGYHLELYSGESTYCYQQFVYMGSSIPSTVQRVKINGAWQPWEWINPPMHAGVEYRTTERCGGSAVYAKRVSYNLGAIDASNTSIDTSIPHGISNFAYLVRSHCAKGVYVLPFIKDNGGFTAIANVNELGIILRTYKATWAADTWFIDIYYVKY